ncbi:STAS domain-containing protein [Jannaschia sp. W003]|uniref:STAS domain-containing protein n=1 Tax=Jannaschia sp. W003 TaxID=2867012 RepID=UPI0021A29053|nr:STAS domain-containing protein [Jannaschia sp. W003]UWQ21443.1 STAS domain-containing protein [Jannaschia sp. W003]
MAIQWEVVGDVLVAEVEDARIDAAGAVAFKEALRDRVAGHGGRVLLDLHRVAFLDSSGLGALVAVMKMLGGRPLELAAPCAVIRKVLRLTRMDEVFVLHDSRADALAPRDAA